MKLLQIICICFINIVGIKCVQRSGLYMRIGSFPVRGKSVKDIFMSKLFKETWMNAQIICLQDGMELLRVDSQEELEVIIRALKLHCTDFGSKLYIDGTRTSDGRWIFLGSNEEFDPRLFDLRGRSGPSENCVSISKDYLSLKPQPTDCSGSRERFLCQKLYKSDKPVSMFAANESFKVDVAAKFLDNIGSFVQADGERHSYFANRYSKLSALMAENFCGHFGMSLAYIDDLDELETLIRAIRRREADNEDFLIGGSNVKDEKRYRTFPYPTLSRQCLALNVDIETGGMFYFNCNDDGTYDRVSFICEKNDGGELEVSERKVAERRTIGMKLLGALEQFDTKAFNVSYYINDAIQAVSWYEAYSFCKSLGMELFSPQSSNVSQQIIQMLDRAGYSTAVAIGASRIGTGCFWYSTASGLEIDFHNLDETSSLYGYQKEMCLQLEKVSDIYQYKDFDCKSPTDRFICESMEP